MDEGERATRVALIDRGKLIADAAPQELRASLGAERLIHAPLSARSPLVAAGLDVTERSGRLTARGTSDQLEHATNELLAAGVAFEVAPPTLGDVYLSLAGRDLRPAEPIAGGAA
jgi:ABC-2 type transport system ATP-binding protein